MQVSAEGRALGEVLSLRQRNLLLASLMLAMFISAIDMTVVSTATPRILADLGGFNLLSWLFTSYMLTSTIVVPLVGKLSDIYGRKVFLNVGIAVFVASSVACGAAPSMPTLIVFRGIQGIGGGMIMACTFATVGDIFPPAERGKYMGMFTGMFSLASVLGPTLGGFLTDNGGWRWVFFINLPLGIIAIPAILKNMPGRKGVSRPKIDWAGAAILSVAAVCLLLAFVWAGQEYAWGSPQIVGLLAAGVVFTGLFLFQETRHPEPILPLHLFKTRTFLVANAIMFVLGVGMMGAMQYLGLFVQTALGASATASGIIGTPQSLGVLVASVISGQVIARTGRYRWITVFGSILILIAVLFLRTLDLDTPRWYISAYMVVLGLGFGCTMPTMSISVQNAVPYKYLGVASSASQFFRQIGGVFGVAIFGAVLTSSYASAYQDRIPAQERQQLESVGVYESFKDPTLRLAPEFRVVAEKVMKLDASGALLGTAVQAQKESVAHSIREIYTFALIGALGGIVLCLLLKEVPLRKSFQTAADAPHAAPEGHAVPSLEGAAPLSAIEPTGGGGGGG